MTLQEIIRAALSARERKSPPPPPTAARFATPPPPMRGEIREEVIAPLPPANAPWPDNILDILLGSRTARPTGTWTPDRPPAPSPEYNSLNARTPLSGEGVKTKEEWDRLRQNYPYIAQYVTRIDERELPPEMWAQTVFDQQGGLPVTIQVDPPKGQMPQTMAHELAHVSQRLAFPEGDVNTLDDFMGQMFGNPNYQQRIGEQQARALERAFLALQSRRVQK